MDVLTDSGWKTVDTIQPGDQVYGSSGQLTPVLARTMSYTYEPCYEVSFTDDSAYVVGENHLWHVRDTIRNRKIWQDLPTNVLAGSFFSRRPDTGRAAYRYRVRCDAVPDTPKARLPIDPYLLGYWLGDGSKNSPRITVGAEDLEWVTARLHRAGAVAAGWGGRMTAPEPRVQSSGIAWDLHFRLDAVMRDGFESRCRQLGVWGAKRVPEIYLTSSVNQRRALLAGLMDSDGSIAVTNRSPQAEFTTSIPGLASDFIRLSRSLGIRVARKEGKVVTAGRQYRARARFLWTPAFNPFELPRKADRWRPPMTRRHELMSITGITPAAPVSARYITVAAPDGVFLIGRNFTPTNSRTRPVVTAG